MGFFRGVDQNGNVLKNVFWRCKNPKTGKLFTVCSRSLSQSIGRGRISREEALDVRESRERRDRNLRRKHRKRQNFGSEKQLSIPIDFFNFFGAAEKLTFLGGG